MGRLLKIKNLIKIGLQAKLRLAQYRHILPANTLSAKYSIHSSLPRSKKKTAKSERILPYSFLGRYFYLRFLMSISSITAYPSGVGCMPSLAYFFGRPSLSSTSFVK